MGIGFLRPGALLPYMCAVFNQLHHASAIPCHFFKTSGLFIQKIQQVNGLSSYGAVYAAINSYFCKS
jgi:hypothetical protein